MTAKAAISTPVSRPSGMYSSLFSIFSNFNYSYTMKSLHFSSASVMNVKENPDICSCSCSITFNL